MQQAQVNGTYCRYLADFPTASPTSYPESNTARGELYEPVRSGKAPFAIIVHGIGDLSTIPCRAFARHLVRQGMACFVLYLVIHSCRISESVRKRMPMISDDEWFECYRGSVIEIRQLIDWAGGQARIDASRVAVLGISLGGFISAIAMGVDERIKAGIFIVAGGNAGKISQLSRLSIFRKGYRQTESKYRDKQSHYAHYLDEVAGKGVENVIPETRSFLTDPMTYGSSLKERPVLMINARWDEVIPREATNDFWESCGRPEILWMPATHATIWAWYPIIRHRITSFLRRD